ncbi:GGDEF domain-containing protein [Oceanispirochaeta sp.]|jgi:GGDEF domain-containing protein|uniref:GGDEF domain-containing protein n=1 Tax=Oceanispirochaeta sp. TaxID=2035350 RepID=UPI002632809F|nr:GGDEF domain-containing protein [Oceanispirochaeta sp.]MDA3956521.1 GGDEF domain-containing protein [Oceanispirochaeta sp.]
MTVENESGTESIKDKSRQIYFSLVTLFILSSIFLLYTLLSQQFKPYFQISQTLCTLWLGTIILNLDRKKVLGDKDIIRACLPLNIVCPLLLFSLNTYQNLIVYNIVLAFFAVYFLFSFPISHKTNLIFYIIFTIEYIVVSIFHGIFSPIEFINSGAILLNLLLLSLGVSLRQSNLYRDDLNHCRRNLNQLKNSQGSSEEGDPILGIFSRSGGMKVLKQTMKWAERYEIPLTVCYMELNGSRDEHINSITRGIFKRIRETDTLFRLGKAEMLLILPDCEKNNALDVIKHIKETLSTTPSYKLLHYGLADFQSEIIRSPNEFIIIANKASETA